MCPWLPSIQQQQNCQKQIQFGGGGDKMGVRHTFNVLFLLNPNVHNIIGRTNLTKKQKSQATLVIQRRPREDFHFFERKKIHVFAGFVVENSYFPDIT